MTATSDYDAVVVGGGHNGLVAAAYLAQAGRRTLVLERLGALGGAAVSERVFAGVDARLSRYSYLVSLLPRKILDDLGVQVALWRRRVSSYTPVERAGRPTGLFVDSGADDRTRASFTAVTGDPAAYDAWQEFYGRTAAVAPGLPHADRPAAHPGGAAARGRRRRDLGRAVRATAGRDAGGAVRR